MTPNNPPAGDTQTLANLTLRWREAIPLLDAMDFAVTGWDGQRLTTKAPLSRNRNDKQTGFAGSIAALTSVTGWGLATLIGESVGRPFQVAIRDCQQSFRKPVHGDLQASASITDDEQWRFVAELRDKGKARVTLNVILGTDDEAECARLEGTYVAWLL